MPALLRPSVAASAVLLLLLVAASRATAATDRDLLRFDDRFQSALRAVAEARLDELPALLDAARAATPRERWHADLPKDCLALPAMTASEARELQARLDGGDFGAPLAVDGGLVTRALIRAGIRAAEQGDRGAARKHVDRAARWADSSLDDDLIAWTAISRAEVGVRHHLLGPLIPSVESELRRLLEHAAVRFARLGRPKDAAYAHVVLAELESALPAPKPERAIDAASRALAEPDLDTDLTLRARCVRVAAEGGLERSDRDREDVDALWMFLDRERGGRRFDVALTLGAWHLERGKRDAEERGCLARRGFDVALGAARRDIERATAREWRGRVHVELGQFDRARRDFETARRELEALGRPLAASRCLRRSAYAEFLAGNDRAALGWLDRHYDTLAEFPSGQGILLDYRFNFYLRSLIAVRSDDLTTAVAANETERHFDEQLVSKLGISDMIFTHERSVPTGAMLGALTHELVHRRPEQFETGFTLITDAIEHARARVLKEILLRARDWKGRPGELAPLPDGVAELRWIDMQVPAELAEPGARRYGLMARFGDEMVFEDLGRRDQINARIESFLSRWLTPESLAEPARSYGDDANEILGAVCGSTAEWFARGGGAPRRLLVMAEGAVQRIPFESLVVRAPAEAEATTFGELDFLVRRTAVLHVPSLTILSMLPAPNDHRLAVAIMDPLLRREDGSVVPPLRFTAQEQRAIESLHDDVIVLRREAATVGGMIAALMDDEEDDSDGVAWLHLSCHAVPDPTHQDRAQLLLATSASESQPAARLNVKEVVQIKLTKGIRVVLSACVTAGGVAHRGEGVLALWRAFLWAGASCVISTLRAVDDRSAACWMESFHRAAVSDELPLAEAARAASLAWLNGERRPRFPRGSGVLDPCHPYLWAAYICLGNDGGPLPKVVDQPGAR